MTQTIALVEDDEIIRSNYADILTAEGFNTVALATATEAADFFTTHLPDLVLLDISLGNDHEAGYEICRLLRQRSSTLPIVFLTSHSSDVDKISGLRLGADDYITKDTSTEYLIIRIRSLFRRIKALSEGTESSTNLLNSFLNINDQTLVATWRNQVVDLSLTQFWILRALADHPGTVLTHDGLMRAANVVVEPNTIVAHIKAIRRKFRDIEPTFDCIRTERGIGYRWIHNSS